MKISRILFVLAGIGLVAFGAKLLIKPKPFLYAGTLETTRIDLSMQLPSRIASVLVQEGDFIHPGQLLIELSCEDFKIASQYLNQNYARSRKLLSTGTLSQDDFDQIQNRKEEADLRLKWCSISSPIQGTVLNRYHEPGEWAPVGTKLLTLANLEDIWTYIFVAQPKIAELKVGMTVRGSLPEMPGKLFSGKIIKINSEAEFTPKNIQTESERTRLVYGIKISFSDSNIDQILKPGMTIEVQL
ncbi:MAG: efflux RND transporter periplasmic adaptor subunit [Myxococcaceae bacterium]|nr:efflux RND transporter periplasmic adaptor subunit [Myxococcaceae bacterium]